MQSTTTTTVQLSPDRNFHYEAIRSLGLAPYGGCDVAETLAVLSKIQPGNVESWYTEWFALAQRVLSTIDESKLSSYSPATLRNVYFRVSHYFFNADFFLHSNMEDPRLFENWKLWRHYFDKANALLPIPGLHATVETPFGFSAPLIVYRAEGASAQSPKPTLLIGGGYDSNYEETLHVFGFPALERGYNVILYEGPGQPSLLQGQHKGFIREWEQVVNPVVDYIFEHSKSDLAFIDTSKIGLLGMSLGGYLAARGAAFEPRLAAAILIDGVYDLLPPFMQAFPDCKEAWLAGDEATFNAAFDGNTSTGALTNGNTSRRWLHDHLKYSFQQSNAFEAMKQAAELNCRGWLDKIKMPTFVGDAAADIFFQGQPQQVALEIGSHATLVEFTAEQAAENHCASGANMFQNNVILDWFSKVIGERE